MARSRNIKPGFFTNEELVEIEPLGRLLFIGLWTLADREGRLEDRPKKIKMELFPCDNCDIDKLLTDLHDGGFIERYGVDNKSFIQIKNFIKHQNPHPKEAQSQIPPPFGHDDSGCIPYYVPQEQRERIFMRDGYKCNYCGSSERLSIDHVKPRSKGGSNDDSNLQTLCVSCNSRKGNDLEFDSRENKLQVTDEQITSPEKEVTSHADSSLLIPDSSLPITETPLLDKNILSGKPNDVRLIIDYLNQKTGSDYRETSKKTVALIKARQKEGFIYQDFITVIDKKYAEWNGTEFQTYLRPETLFGTKFESYLNQKMALKRDNRQSENPQAEMARRAIEMLKNQQKGDEDNET